jgi:hypothetical protein
LTAIVNDIQAYLSYRQEKLKQISILESKRLEDLKDARATIFKYALPATLIDTIAGGFATYLTNNVLYLLPTVLFVILIYYLADQLDRKKYSERLHIIQQTVEAQDKIDSTEAELLRRV